MTLITEQRDKLAEQFAVVWRDQMRKASVIALSLFGFVACGLGAERACEGNAEDTTGPIAVAVEQAGGNPTQGKTTKINCDWDWNFPRNISGSSYATVQSGNDTWGLEHKNGEWVVVANSKNGCDGLTGDLKESCNEAD